MKFKTLINQFDNFMFAPSSPYPVAAFRIFFGLMIIQNAILIYPDLLVWYGKDGIYLDKTNNVLQPFVSLNILSLFSSSDTWLYIVFFAYLLGGIALTIGFKSRIASILIWFIIVSFYHRNCYLLNSGDTFFRVISFWLMFAPTGAAWSIDHYSRIKKHGAEFSELVPTWGLRCLQIQFCFVYYHAVATKVPGWPWVYGVAVYISSRLEGLARFPLIPSPEIITVTQLVCWLTLLTEFALYTLIWIKELRYYVMALGLCMHLTIDWTMNIPQFEWMMIGALLLFVYPIDFEKLVSKINSITYRILSSSKEHIPSQG